MIQLDERTTTTAPDKSNSENKNNKSIETKTDSVQSGISPLIEFLYPLARFVVMPFYFRQLQVRGQENIPRTEPVILAPTHRSRWDALIVPHVAGKPTSGRNLRFMVTADECQGIQGWLIQHLGGFPVNTHHPSIGTIRHSIELLHNGEPLVVFPEGHIYQHGEVNPLKPGLARIALQAESSQPGSGLKILPISIRYSHPQAPWRCKVSISIGSPLNVADYSTKSIKQSAPQLRSALQAALEEVDAQNEALANF